MALKTAKGLALQDILTEVHHYVHRSKLVINEITEIFSLFYRCLIWSKYCVTLTLSFSLCFYSL